MLAILDLASMPHLTLPLDALEALGITDGEPLDSAPAAENLAMVAAGRLEPALAPRGFDVTQVIRVLVFDSEEGGAPLPFA